MFLLLHAIRACFYCCLLSEHVFIFACYQSMFLLLPAIRACFYCCMLSEHVFIVACYQSMFLLLHAIGMIACNNKNMLCMPALTP